MDEREAVAAIRAGLGLADEVDADFGERMLDSPALIVSSVDRAEYGTTPPDEPLDIWAFRAINAALSDLACAGVSSAFAQIDVQVPSTIEFYDLLAIGHGIRTALTELGVELINGNNMTSGPLAMTTVAHGWRVPDVRPPGRAGAGVGDWIVSSRLPGRFTSALEALAGQRDAPWVSASLLGGVAELKFGRLVVDRRLATALIDANDCLLLTARDLARASRVGILIDRDAIESQAEALAWRPSIETILAPPSGDLALIAAVPNRHLREFCTLAEDTGHVPAIVGRVVDGGGEVSVPGFSFGELDEICARRWRSPGPVFYPSESVRRALATGGGSW